MLAGHVEEARAELQSALDQNPNQAELQLIYGRLLLANREFALAEWPLRKAAEDPEYEDTANRVLGEVLLGTGNAPAALVVINRVLENSPDDVSALEFRARARLEASDAEGGLKDAERVIELEPERISARTTQLYALLLMERVEDAEKALASLRSSAAEDSAEFNLEEKARFCALECRFLLEKGESDAAFEQVKVCLEESPADKRVIREASDHFAMRGDFQGLRTVLERAIEHAPGETEFRVALADRLRGGGEVSGAEALLREGIEFHVPQRPIDWHALYEHFWEVKDYAGAVGALEKAISLAQRPGTAVRLRLADAQIQLKDYEAAARTAEDLGEGYRDLVVGRIALDRGDLLAARESLQRGLRVWPHNATARVLLGETESRAGDLEQALVEYLEAYRIEYGPSASGEKSDSALRVARLQAAMGSYQGATDFASRHVSDNPTDLDAVELVIVLASRMGSTQVVERGLQTMANMFGKVARSAVLHAELVEEAGGGAKAAVQAIKSQKLDLTEPAHFRALEALVRLRQRDDPLAALTLVERATLVHADVPNFMALQGSVLAGIPGRESEAQDVLERVLTLEPAHAAAQIALARMHAARGELESAIEAYDAAALADPEDAAIPVEAAERLAEDPARRVEAQNRLEAALDRHPLYAPAASALALIHLAADDPDKALAYASRAMAYGGMLKNREAARSLEVLGRVQLARGAVDEAVAALGKAVELDAERASAQEQLSLAREALQRREAERG